MYRSLNTAAEILARLLAYAGGAVLLGITLLTCVSIIGRVFVPLNIGIGPIAALNRTSRN